MFSAAPSNQSPRPTLESSAALRGYCRGSSAWLKDIAVALNNEYRFRFEKESDHKSISILNEISIHDYEKKGLTEFAQAMPGIYKVPGNPVKAYREFYLGEKMAIAKWTKRGIPYWVRNSEYDAEKCT